MATTEPSGAVAELDAVMNELEICERHVRAFKSPNNPRIINDAFERLAGQLLELAKEVKRTHRARVACAQNVLVLTIRVDADGAELDHSINLAGNATKYKNADEIAEAMMKGATTL